MLSSILYISIFFATYYLINLSKSKKINTPIVLYALSFPIIMATIRYGVGTDYFNYKRSFDRSMNLTFLESIQMNGLKEVSFCLFNMIGNSFKSYHVLLFLVSLSTIIIMFLSIEKLQKKDFISLSIFIYLCIYYPSSLNLMSQFIAISIVAYSYKFIFEKNFKKYIICILFATSFHSTAAFMFPMYYLWDKFKGITIKKAIISIIIVGIVSILYQPILEFITQFSIFEDYSSYIAVNTRANNRDIILKILLLLILVMYRKKLISYDYRNSLYILLILFNVMMGFTGATSPWIKRIGLYFEISQIYILPHLIGIQRYNKNKLLAYFLILGYAIGYFLLVYVLLGQSHVIPYKINI